MKAMQVPGSFMRDLFKGPKWIAIWVMILMIVNLAGLALWQEPLAQVIVYTFMVTSLWMMVLYARFSMTRILGLGHVLWLILVPYLALQWPNLSGDIQAYVSVVIVCNTISLIFDINDVRLHFTQL